MWELCAQTFDIPIRLAANWGAFRPVSNSRSMAGAGAATLALWEGGLGLAWTLESLGAGLRHTEDERAFNVVARTSTSMPHPPLSDCCLCSALLCRQLTSCTRLALPPGRPEAQPRGHTLALRTTLPKGFGAWRRADNCRPSWLRPPLMQSRAPGR